MRKIFNCAICGKKFTGGYFKAKYCSHECRAAALKIYYKSTKYKALQRKYYFRKKYEASLV